MIDKGNWNNTSDKGNWNNTSDKGNWNNTSDKGNWNNTWSDIVDLFNNNENIMKVLDDWSKSMDKRNKKIRSKKKFKKVVPDDPPKLFEDEVSRK